MRKADKERAEAIEDLRKIIKPGDVVNTILEHVSRSGMSRSIRVLVPYHEVQCSECRTDLKTPHGEWLKYCADHPDAPVTERIDFLHPNYSVSVALGLRRSKREGVIMGGCGMDMGFALVYELSHALYPTYRCLGKGRCPSNYHVNHHDTIRCPANCYNVKIWRGEIPEARRNEYHNVQATPELLKELDWMGRTWTREDDTGTRVDLPWLYVHVRSNDDDTEVHPCHACGGKGRIPNPEGPERFDLEHNDGYALRQRWL